MAFAEAVMTIFLMVLGIGMYWYSDRKYRNGNATFAWNLFGSILFLVLTWSSFALPFSVDSDGYTIVRAENIILSGVNLMLCCYGVMMSWKNAMEYFNK
jgi:hypothetical protein